MKYFLIFLMGFILISCGSESANMNDLTQNGDLVFIKGTSKPFTGTAIINDKKTNKKIEEIEFVEGRMHGKSQGWYLNGNQSYISYYDDGKETSTESWEEDGTKKN